MSHDSDDGGNFTAVTDILDRGGIESPWTTAGKNDQISCGIDYHYQGVESV